MATKQTILSSTNRRNEDIYTLCTMPNADGKSLSIKILHFNTAVEQCFESNILTTTGHEILDYSDELYDKVYDTVYSTALFYMLDPYYRAKFANTEIYNLLYYQTGSYDGNSFSGGSAKHYTRNLIVLDKDAILYLYYLTKNSDFVKHKTLFESMIRQNLSYDASKKNARQRLRISKKKEKVLKQFLYPWILQYDNNVFEDDVDFLIEVVKTQGYSASTILNNFLDIKKANLKLTYQQIAKCAILMNLENSTSVPFSEAMSSYARLAKSFRQLHGYDGNFRLSRAIPIATTLDFQDHNKATAPTFEVENAKVYPITSEGGMRYANAISNAFSANYLNAALNAGSQFYFVVKHGKYYLGETKNGLLINLKRNGAPAYLFVNYTDDRKDACNG